MTVWSIGAYVEDKSYYVSTLPRPGESVGAESLLTSHGGKAANQAVAAARLGAPARFVGTVGTDPAGDAARAMFAREGVVAHLGASGEATGSSAIIVDGSGAQLVVTWPGASASLTVETALEELQSAVAGDVVLLQGEIDHAVTEAVARAATYCVVVCNPSPVLEFLGADNVWTCVDVVIANETEAADLMGVQSADQDGAAEALADVLGVTTTIVTRGAAGAVLFTGGRTVSVTAPPVRAVDTTGAGDAFTGAFAACLSRGGEQADAVADGVVAGAIAVTRRGCVPSFASLDELRSWR